MGKLFKFKAKKGRTRPVKAGKRLKAIIQKEIHKDAEKKFLDNLIYATGGGSAPYLLDATAEVVPTINTVGGASVPYGLLAVIPEGTSNNTRIGDAIRVKSMVLRFRATAFSAVASGVVYVVRFPQSNGAAPTLANIWSQVTDIATAQRNPTYMNDYHILGKINISASNGTTLNKLFTWKKTYRGPGMKVTYDGSTSAIDDVESNNVFLIAQSNGSDDVISISNGVFRVNYYDS